MPRIYTGSNDPLDFCAYCFPSEIKAWDDYGFGEGPDGRGNCFEYDAEHPTYDGTDYVCEKCKEPLGEADDYARKPYRKEK